MALPISTPKQWSAAPSSRGVSRALAVIGAAVAAVIVVAALALWFHYGTAVFFETIAAGIANCF